MNPANPGLGQVGTLVATGSPSATRYGSIVASPDGILYAPSYQTTDNKGTIDRWNLATGAYLGFWQPAGFGTFANLSGIAYGPDGYLYIVGYSNASGSNQWSIFKVSPTDGTTTVWATLPNLPAQFPYPVNGPMVGQDGYLYVSWGPYSGTGGIYRYDLITAVMVGTGPFAKPGGGSETGNAFRQFDWGPNKSGTLVNGVLVADLFGGEITAGIASIWNGLTGADIDPDYSGPQFGAGPLALTFGPFSILYTGDFSTGSPCGTLHRVNALTGAAAPTTPNICFPPDNVAKDIKFWPTAGEATYSLGNRVWKDDGAGGGTANNGIQDGGEAGVGGVTVELYNSSNALVGSTTTDGGGYYRFDFLPAGSYTIKIVAANFASGGPLNGYLSSTGTLSGDQRDKGVDNADPAANGISSAAVSVGPGSQPTGEPDLGGGSPNPPRGHGPGGDSNDNLQYDFGFYPKPTAVELVYFKSIVSREGGLDVFYVEWQTANEIDTVGFEVYRWDRRSQGSHFVGQVIPATGPGSVYRLKDATGASPWRNTYLLRELTSSGYDDQVFENIPVKRTRR